MIDAVHFERIDDYHFETELTDYNKPVTNNGGDIFVYTAESGELVLLSSFANLRHSYILVADAEGKVVEIGRNLFEDSADGSKQIQLTVPKGGFVIAFVYSSETPDLNKDLYDFYEKVLLLYNGGKPVYNSTIKVNSGFYLGVKVSENMVCGTITHIYIPVVTPPTCTEPGYTTYMCPCGDSYVSDYVDETGHIYESVVTPPTCTEQGYTTHTCHCGDSYVSDYVDETGHDDGEWVVVKEATEDNNGLKELQCTVCHEVLDFEVIPSKPAYLLGDANGDGKINARDYARVKRYCLNTLELSEEELLAADVNGDGKVNARDYGLIKRHCLGTYVIGG